MKQIRIAGFLIALVTLIIDQLSKQWILAWFMNGHHQLKVTPFFNIILAANKGVSFGMLPAGSIYGVWSLIGLAIAISFLLGLWIWQAETKSSGICFGLILGGALGNVIDRILYSAVIDFLDFHAMGYHWYTFNIADCGIVIGSVLLIIQMLYNPKKSNQH